jgi:dipeptidyl aminopeptidase/acylaminoacyl peptidase
VDTWSRVDQPPVHELRRASDGGLVCELGRADDAAMVAAGWTAPERVVAKGRDGATDIWGVVWRPCGTAADHAPRPVVEQIYAGPQDFFVPKEWSPWHRQRDLTREGVCVVQVDGMGTNWRGKKFHDVCWKNLKDAGLPDHVAWLRAAAAARPWMDLGRVGIYGGSAGGQNAMRALLDFPDVYKVGVADCGCHDNRMDKIWWNELWMGWPVDESYARSSNVVDAAKLRGRLMLVVGEVDDNVDPASTMQVAAALERAGKDFELVVVAGAGHGAAETPYGSMRRRGFLLRHLLGQAPPAAGAAGGDADGAGAAAGAAGTAAGR